MKAALPVLAALILAGAPEPPPRGAGDSALVLRTVAGEGVDETDALRWTRDLAAFLRAQGLTVVVREPVRRVPERHLWNDGCVGGRCVGEFLRGHAQPATREVQLVFMSRLTPLDSPSADALGDLLGLGMSPRTAPREAIELEGAFTPTAWLSVSALGRTPEPDRAMAHELLHALGLRHGEGPDGLLGGPANSQNTEADWRAVRDAIIRLNGGTQ